MRDSSLGETKSGIFDSALADEPTRLAKFQLGKHFFQLVICQNKHTPQPAELVRFDLNGSTVAIVEEVAPVETRDLLGRLTGQELQIASLVAQGDATKNIAYKLRISEWTVITHLRRIFAKLNVENRAAMVYICSPLIKRAAEAADAGHEAFRKKRSQARGKVDAPTVPIKKRTRDLVKV